MAAGYTFVQAMFKAGRNPTRQDLLNAINGGLPQGPSVAPYAYSATDHNGITGAYIAIIKNGALVPQGPVLVTDTSPTGAITPFIDSRSRRRQPAGFRRHDQAPGGGRGLPPGAPAGTGRLPGSCLAAGDQARRRARSES